MARVTPTSRAPQKAPPAVGPRSSDAAPARSAASGAPAAPASVELQRPPGTGDAQAADAGRAALLAGTEHPFAALAERVRARHARPVQLSEPVDLSRDLGPEPAHLARLAEVESAAAVLAVAGDGAAMEAVAKIREGMLLTLADAVDVHRETAGGISAELVERVAGQVNDAVGTPETSTRIRETISRGTFPATLDINAFVQAVLREAYLEQNLQLRDYAEKVRYFNEIKKQIRAQTTWAREVAVDLEDGDVIEEPLWYYDIEKGEWAEYQAGEVLGTAGDSSSTSGSGGGAFDDGDAPLDYPPGAATDAAAAALIGAAQSPSGPPSNPLTAELLDLLGHHTSWYPKPGWKKIVGELFQFLTTHSPADVARAAANLPDDARALLLSWANAAATYDYGIDVPGFPLRVPPDLFNPVGMELLTRLAEVLPYEQLARLQGGISDDRFTSWNRISGYVLSQRLDACATALEQLPAELRTGPTAGLAHHYAQFLTEGRGFDAFLRELHEVSKTDPHAAIAFLAMMHARGDGSVELGAALTACDLDSLFGVANDAETSRLLEIAEAAGLVSSTSTSAFQVPRARATVGAAAEKVAGTARQAVDVSVAGARAHLPSQSMPRGEALDAFRESVQAPVRAPVASAASDGMPPPFDASGASDGMLASDGQSTGGYFDSSLPHRQLGPQKVTKESWDAYIKALEDSLNQVGDDAQLANVDLQNALQKQQQLLQMMSNISKILHDTATSIIRKIGA